MFIESVYSYQQEYKKFKQREDVRVQALSANFDKDNEGSGNVYPFKNDIKK